MHLPVLHGIRDAGARERISGVVFLASVSEVDDRREYSRPLRPRSVSRIVASSTDSLLYAP
jgi:hypothetical protein